MNTRRQIYLVWRDVHKSEMDVLDTSFEKNRLKWLKVWRCKPSKQARGEWAVQKAERLGYPEPTG
jgi:hypothetical protein